MAGIVEVITETSRHLAEVKFTSIDCPGLHSYFEKPVCVRMSQDAGRRQCPFAVRVVRQSDLTREILPIEADELLAYGAGPARRAAVVCLLGKSEKVEIGVPPF